MLDPTEFARRLQRPIDDARDVDLVLGTVTRVDTELRVVDVAISVHDEWVIESVPWVIPLAQVPVYPEIGQMVAMLRVGANYLVLGANSKLLTGEKETQVLAQTVSIYNASTAMTGGWFWESGPASGPISQGLRTTSGLAWYEAGAVVLQLNRPVPTGAVLVKGKLTVRRTSGGAALVAPVFYRHNIAKTPASGTDPANAFLAGSWSPGSLTQGQKATWDFPSSWADQLAAGTIRGLGIRSTGANAYAVFDQISLELTYTGGLVT